jgi:hypothetical protein
MGVPQSMSVLLLLNPSMRLPHLKTRRLGRQLSLQWIRSRFLINFSLAAFHAALAVEERHLWVDDSVGFYWERQHQAQVLHDLIGNPFRPITAEPKWLAGSVVAIARAIYEDRTYDCLPILADALMDAGCHDEQILVHCRSEGPHVRGCWVVDLLLAKE